MTITRKSNNSDDPIVINLEQNTGCAPVIVVCLVLIFLSWGSPDIWDGLVNWLMRQ